MSVNLIFKIAAVGILVSVISQVLSTAAGRNRHFSPVWQVWYWCCSGSCPIFLNCLIP